MNTTPALSENMEDYLERIFDLVRKEGVARVSEVAKLKEVSQPSVNHAVRYLAERGFVTHRSHQHINLTKSGAMLAGRLQKRHDAIKKLLVDECGVRPEIAEKDACTIEHHLHEETIDKIIRKME